MSMIYSDFVTALARLLQYNIVTATSATPSDSGPFNDILPRCIEYTELKMQRDPDLDFLASRGTASSQTTIGSNLFTTPSNIIVLEALFAVTPAGTQVGAAGASRNPVLPATTDFINHLYPNPNAAGVANVPKYWAPLTETTTSKTIVLGPGADAAYFIEARGTARFPALSSTNTSNVLTTLLPDLYLAAAMEFMTGFQRDFGQQADDPKMAMSWSAEYEKLKLGAAIEEARKKLRSEAWSSYPPAKIVQPPRA